MAIQFFFFKQKTACEIRLSLVGSEMCIRDRDIERIVPCRTFVETGNRLEILALPRIERRQETALPGDRTESARFGAVVVLIAERTVPEQRRVLPAAERIGQQRQGMVGDIVFQRVRHGVVAVSYTHLRAHETKANLVCRLLLEKKKKIRETYLCRY